MLTVSDRILVICTVQAGLVKCVRFGSARFGSARFGYVALALRFDLGFPVPPSPNCGSSS
eukprot:4977739-Lingulodinium_polyedra.AAC.1